MAQWPTSLSWLLYRDCCEASTRCSCLSSREGSEPFSRGRTDSDDRVGQRPQGALWQHSSLCYRVRAGKPGCTGCSFSPIEHCGAIYSSRCPCCSSSSTSEYTGVLSSRGGAG